MGESWEAGENLLPGNTLFYLLTASPHHHSFFTQKTKRRKQETSQKSQKPILSRFFVKTQPLALCFPWLEGRTPSSVKRPSSSHTCLCEWLMSFFWPLDSKANSRSFHTCRICSSHEKRNFSCLSHRTVFLSNYLKPVFLFLVFYYLIFLILERFIMHSQTHRSLKAEN